MFGFRNKKQPAPAQPAPRAREEAGPSWPEYLAKRTPPFKLNLGCGSCFHAEWVNLDFVSNSPDVFSFDLRKRLPLPDHSCKVVYHSHVLEHFRRDDATNFIAECARVLQPGGILRVAVPDLETIARVYLQNLELASEGDATAGPRHEWMTIEMIDQLARERSGGEMLKFWKQNPMPAEDFVIERLGREVLRFLEYYRSLPPEQRKEPAVGADDPLEIGRFRLAGEPHKWMYDRVSLKQLLASAGLVDIAVKRADESRIEGFNRSGLDLHSDGSVRKPDSLFMEARKT